MGHALIAFCWGRIYFSGADHFFLLLFIHLLFLLLFSNSHLPPFSTFCLSPFVFLFYLRFADFPHNNLFISLCCLFSEPHSVYFFYLLAATSILTYSLKKINYFISLADLFVIYSPSHVVWSLFLTIQELMQIFIRKNYIFSFTKNDKIDSDKKAGVTIKIKLTLSKKQKGTIFLFIPESIPVHKRRFRLLLISGHSGNNISARLGRKYFPAAKVRDPGVLLNFECST